LTKSTKQRTHTLISGLGSNTNNTGLTLHLTATSTNNHKEVRRSAESHRALSQVLSNSHQKSKRSNSIITKLLASIETLSALCLKEAKLGEASQLVKMYSTNPIYSKAINSFEYRQILFHSIYQQTIAELNKLKRNTTNDSKNGKKLMDLSMQSLDVAKITEKLLDFELENELLQSIFLLDILVVSKFDLTLSSNLIDYARIKLNQYLMKYSNGLHEKDKSNKENEQEGEHERSNLADLNYDLNQHETELNKFDQELRMKLSQFIESSQFVCANFVSTDETESNVNKHSSLDEILFSLEGINCGLNTRNLLSSENTQVLMNKQKQFALLKKQLNELKAKFESKLENDSNVINEKHDTFLSLMTLINDSIRLNDNENLISTFFYKPNYGIVKNGQAAQAALATGHFFHESYDIFLNSVEKSALSQSLKMTSKDSSTGDSNSFTSTSIGSSNIVSKSSNYLLSFYEYSKILYEYFKEKSSSIITTPGSYFSILDSSPASLICKLIFEGNSENSY
jgi:hypothetical protein